MVDRFNSLRRNSSNQHSSTEELQLTAAYNSLCNQPTRGYRAPDAPPPEYFCTFLAFAVSKGMESVTTWTSITKADTSLMAKMSGFTLPLDVLMVGSFIVLQPLLLNFRKM